ncbi:hypothetical protein [uncultured Tessaracoccus sp.]|uniref:hypothetical protein n=1 Tax=uncultured Tessaracoccus sp. TaxID=905023 RepID=UPI0025E3EAE9|nr:hypothetical protein [uncultured Tessaracoccus sp.]
MARRSTLRDPMAVAIWVMSALVMWVAILASQRLGALVWRWMHPGEAWSGEGQPPWLVHGLVAVGVTVAICVAVCLKLRLGLWWMLFALVLASLLYVTIPIFPQPLGELLFLVVPPVTAALFLRPVVREPEAGPPPDEG